MRLHSVYKYLEINLDLFWSCLLITIYYYFKVIVNGITSIYYVNNLIKIQNNHLTSMVEEITNIATAINSS